jgi:hypothetical protein
LILLFLCSGGLLHTLTLVHSGLPIRNVTLTSRSVTNDRCP